MKKYTLSAIVLAVLVLIILLLGTQTEEEAPFVVRAPDGSATLSIPADAVLTGGTREDIVMLPISPKDFFVNSTQPTENAKIYRLEPDGLTFSKPATISVSYPHNPKVSYSPVFLAHSGEEGAVTSLNITDATIDEQAGKLTVTGELPHFSIFVSNPEPHIFTALNEPAERITKKLGETFAHTLSVTPGKWEYTTHPSTISPEYTVDVTLEIGNGTRWNVNTDYRSPHLLRTAGNIVPQEVVRAPANLGATESYRLSTDYTCKIVGDDTPAVVGGIWFSYTLQLTSVNSENQKPYVARDVRLGWVSTNSHTRASCIPDASGSTVNTVSSGAGVTPTAPLIPATTQPKKPSGGVMTVCGLPGGPACPKH